VQLEAQANWKVVMDRVVNGELDGSHMLAAAPLASSFGFGNQADIVTAFSMGFNGNAITVANDIWKQMKANVPMEGGKPVHPIKADALKPVVEKYKAAGKPFNMAMTFPSGTHNINCVTGWRQAASTPAITHHRKIIPDKSMPMPCCR